MELEICSSPGNELEFFHQRFRVKTHPMQITRQITPLQDLLGIFRMICLFRKRRINLVHAHTPKAGFIAMTAARLAGVKCRIYTCHGLPLETEKGLKRWLLIMTERIICSLSQLVLVVSNSLQQKILENKLCSSKKVTMIGNGTACGIDLNRFTRNKKIEDQAFELKKKCNLTPENLVIGFIGRLVPDKGIHILVDSFLLLSESMRNIRLFVIGDFEPHRGRLPDATVEILNNHPSIIRCAFTDEIETYYAAMDILVLPTRREGFPYALLEAAAMGLAVIATKTTGCVDAVLDGQTGFLVPANDVIALKAVMQTLLGSSQLRRRMGQAARKRIEQQFSSKFFLEAHIKLYCKMLNMRDQQVLGKAAGKNSAG